MMTLDSVERFIRSGQQRRWLERDIAAYRTECGREPIVDRFKPDLIEQSRRRSAYWLEWYRRPMVALERAVSGAGGI